MGLITKEVTVKPSGKTIQYYKDKGYKAEWHQPLTVSVNDLPNSSNALVEVSCDIPDCNNVSTMTYDTYNKITKENPLCVCKEHSWVKARITYENRTGYKNPLLNPEVKEKSQETVMRKYGVNGVLSVPKFREKFNTTNLERWGTINPMENEEIKQKQLNTLMNNYGVTNPMFSDEIKQRQIDTCIEKYGTEYYMNTEEFKNAKKQYFDDPEKMTEWLQKWQDNFRKKYNANYMMQVPNFKAKRVRTMYENATVNTSLQQRYIHLLFGGELNYPVGERFWGDIVFPDEKIICEIDFSGHDLCVKLGNVSQKEFDQKEIIRHEILKRTGYKTIHLISHTDKLPSDSKLLEILELSKQYFKEYPNHSWIEWYLDDGFYRNAEHKDGIPYDFGELRKIKKEEIA